MYYLLLLLVIRPQVLGYQYILIILPQHVLKMLTVSFNLRV